MPDHFGREEVLAILREYYGSLTEKVEPEDLQNVVKEAAEAAAEYHTKLFVDEEAGLKDFFKSNGVTITEPNTDEFKAAMQPVYDEYIKKNGKLGEEGVKEINSVR